MGNGIEPNKCQSSFDSWAGKFPVIKKQGGTQKRKAGPKPMFKIQSLRYRIARYISPSGRVENAVVAASKYAPALSPLSWPFLLTGCGDLNAVPSPDATIPIEGGQGQKARQVFSGVVTQTVNSRSGGEKVKIAFHVDIVFPFGTTGRALMVSYSMANNLLKVNEKGQIEEVTAAEAAKLSECKDKSDTNCAPFKDKALADGFVPAGFLAQFDGKYVFQTADKAKYVVRAEKKIVKGGQEYTLYEYNGKNYINFYSSKLKIYQNLYECDASGNLYCGKSGDKCADESAIKQADLLPIDPSAAGKEKAVMEYYEVELGDKGAFTYKLGGDKTSKVAVAIKTGSLSEMSLKQVLDPQRTFKQFITYLETSGQNQSLVNVLKPHLLQLSLDSITSQKLDAKGNLVGAAKTRTIDYKVAGDIDPTKIPLDKDLFADTTARFRLTFTGTIPRDNKSSTSAMGHIGAVSTGLYDVDQSKTYSQDGGL